MGLFSIFFGLFRSSKIEENDVPWHRLTSIDQIGTIIKESKECPIAIFKHSTRCGISRMVFRDFQMNYTIPEDQMKLYYLDILSYREVSNEVSIKFQVFHESPQLLIVKNGKTIHHSSHYRINAGILGDFVEIDV